MRTSEQVNDLFAALAKAQGEMPTIAKTKQAKVKGQSKEGRSFEYSYAYADIADVLEAVLPVLSRHGLSVTQPTVVDGPALMIATRLGHSSGQWIESLYPVCSINGDHQKMGGAMTYARRYALCSLLGIAADEDTDGEGVEHPVAPEKRKETPPQQVAPKPAGAPVPATELVAAIRAKDSLADLDRLWKSARFLTDFSLLSEEDKASVKAADTSHRAALGADQKAA